MNTAAYVGLATQLFSPCEWEGDLSLTKKPDMSEDQPRLVVRICRSRCEYYQFYVTRDCINLSLYNSDTRFFFLYSNVTIGGWIGCASCHTNLCRYVNPSHSWNTLWDAYITRKFSRRTILTQTYAPLDYKPSLLFAKICYGGIFVSNLSPPWP